MRPGFIGVGSMLWVWILLGGCGTDGGQDQAAKWLLSPEPSLEIGIIEGEEPYQFHNVRGVARLANGRVVVGNAGTSELRVFDEEGQYLFTAGGPGDGPGEFRRLSSVDVARGDSLVVFDSGAWRVSLFASTGEFVRSWSLESLGRGVFPDRATALQDGTILLFHIRGSMPGDPSGVIHFSAPAVRFSAEGEVLNEVADVPGDEWFRWESDEGWTLMFLPFGTKGHVGVHDDQIYLGSGSEGELRVLGFDGQERKRLPVPIEPRMVTNADIRRFEDESLEGAGDANRRAHLREVHRGIPYPEFMPRYGALVVDTVGRLWIKEYRRTAEDPSRWWVLDRSGEILGAVQMPERFEPSWIEEGLVLGVLTDDLGVEYVRAYQIVIP